MIQDELQGQLVVAERVMKSGLLPTWISTPDKALAVMMAAKELGIPPMTGFREIFLVNGKVGLSAKIMLGMIFKKYPSARISYKETETSSTVTACRPGDEPSSFTFTLDDAKKAGLLTKGPWQTWPKQMLRWRAVSQMAMALFPDVMMGAYFAEEIGAEVNNKGEIVGGPDSNVERAQELTKQLSAPTPIVVNPEPIDIKAEEVQEPQPEPMDSALPRNADYVIKVGRKYKDRRLCEVPTQEIVGYLQYLKSDSAKSGRPISGLAMEFVQMAEPYLADLSRTDDQPF